MNVQTLDQRRDEVQIVDVRWPNEWDAGHIDGARHVPLDVLGDRLFELDRSRPVVTVCRSGNRSADAARTLQAEGFDAQNLDGGMLAWDEAGLALVASDGSRGRVAEPEPPADDGDDEQQRFHAEFMSLTLEVQEHFGDRQPSEEDVRAFLRERLIAEGKTPDEADELLENMSDNEDEAPEGAGKENSNGL